MSCSICLDNFKTPVVTPCGHIFCQNCLISSSQRSSDATQAPCPTCRTQFSLVTPNSVFIPHKYHQFIDSNIRRIYIDDPKTRRLQERVAQLEARVKSLEGQKDLLMKRCESSMEAAQDYARREMEARMGYDRLEKELKQANKITNQLLRSENRLPKRTSTLPVIDCGDHPVFTVEPLEEMDAFNSHTPVRKDHVNYTDANRSYLPLKRRRVMRKSTSVLPSTK